MKRIIVIFTAIGLLAGCSDFLKPDDKGGITNDDLYSTKVGYETIITSAYQYLRIIYGDNPPFLLMAGTDIYEGPVPNLGNDASVYLYSIFPNNNRVTDFYTNVYQGIQRCNMALYYNSFPKDIDENLRAQYKSEMRFLRAFFHFLLVEQFGGVCINNEATLSPRTSMPRNTLAESYEFIINEIEDCIGTLGKSTVGRVNQDVANHYLAKIYLTRGWDLNNQDDFTKAKQYAQKVFDSRGGIVLTYEDLWSWKNENNSEILFAVQYDQKSIPNITGGNCQQQCFAPYLGGSESFAKSTNSQFIPTWGARKWYSENDSRYETSFMSIIYEFYFDYYTVADKSALKVRAYFPRVWRTITQDDLNAWATKFPTTTEFYLRPFYENDVVLYRSYPYAGMPNRWTAPLRKFDDVTTAAVTTQGRVSVRDIVLARLAETYYLYAEACIGLNDFTTAAAYVRKVINRPGNAKFGVLPNAIEGAANREEALHGYLIESGKEFMGEYNGRWPELRRTGMLKFMTERYNYQMQTEAGNIDFNKFKLRPIPESAILLNDALTAKDQNPGY